MATVTISDIRNWMNDTFVSKVEDQLNREILAVELFKQHNTGFTDGQAIVPINYARNNSGGYRGETSDLPTAGEIGRARLSVDAKYLYSRMELTGPAIESGRNNPNGLKATLQEEIDGCLESLSNRANNYFFSGGGCIGFITERNGNIAARNVDFFGNAEHIPAKGTTIDVDLVRLDTYETILSNRGMELATTPTSATSSAVVNFDGPLIDTSGLPEGTVVAVVVNSDQTYADASAGGTAETVEQQTTGILHNLASGTHFSLNRATAHDGGKFVPLQSNFDTGITNANGLGVDFESKQLQNLLTKIQRQSDKRPDMFFVEHGFGS